MIRFCILTVFVSMVCANPVDKVQNKNKTLEKEATILNFDSHREKNGEYAYRSVNTLK